jgi:hypothetical protein
MSKKSKFSTAITREHAKARDTLGKSVDIHDEAVLDNPDKFFQHPRSGYSSSMDRLVNSRFVDAPEGPVSGDDIAKMRNSRTEFGKNKSTYDDPEGHITLYRKFDDADERGTYSIGPNMVAPPDRANDKSRRPSMGGY